MLLKYCSVYNGDEFMTIAGEVLQGGNVTYDRVSASVRRCLVSVSVIGSGDRRPLRPACLTPSHDWTFTM